MLSAVSFPQDMRVPGALSNCRVRQVKYILNNNYVHVCICGYKTNANTANLTNYRLQIKLHYVGTEIQNT
jgi:hypothetical protein